MVVIYRQSNNLLWYTKDQSTEQPINRHIYSKCEWYKCFTWNAWTTRCSQNVEKFKVERTCWVQKKKVKKKRTNKNCHDRVGSDSIGLENFVVLFIQPIFQWRNLNEMKFCGQIIGQFRVFRKMSKWMNEWMTFSHHKRRNENKKRDTSIFGTWALGPPLFSIVGYEKIETRLWKVTFEVKRIPVHVEITFRFDLCAKDLCWGA